LSAEVDASAAAACASPNTNRAARMMIVLCIRHFPVSQTIP
jgi:hypothetical protein